LLGESDKHKILTLCEEYGLTLEEFLDLLKFRKPAKYSGDSFFKLVNQKYPNLALTDLHSVISAYSTWDKSYMWFQRWKEGKTYARLPDLELLAYTLNVDIEKML
jgi:hypothetical protein